MNPVAEITTPSWFTDRFGNTAALDRYWREFLRRKWIVASILIGCVIAALILTLLMTPVYTSEARIQINRTQDNVTNVEGLESEDAGKSLEFYQTQYSLLDSRSLAERVARALNLANDPAFVTAYGLDEADDASVEATPHTSSDARLKRVVGILRANVEIEPIRGSSLVDVSFTSPEPRLSAKIANTWTEQFIQANLDRGFASTREARDFLESQLETLRERLEESERELVNYASNKRIIALTTSESSDGSTRTERTLASSDLEALNEELAAATAARIAAASTLQAGRSVAPDSLTNSTINGLRHQRALVAAEYAKLLAKFEPGYPAAQALQSELRSLDQALAREEARIRTNQQAEYAQATAREAQLRQQVEGLKNELIGQRRDSIQYAIFQREVDTNRQLYDALLQRYKEIGVAGVGSNNVAVIDPAEPASSPSSPNLALNLLLAAILGLGLSAAVVFLLDYLDQSLRDPQEVHRTLGLPLLGSVPRTRDGDILDQISDRKTPASEAYLSIKTSLSFLTDHGVPRSFMFTSTGPNEGKSVSALAVARSLSRSGAKVILIDADMRNPSACGLLGLEEAHGLTNYLSGQDALESLIRETGVENLALIGAGPQPPNAAELLSGSRLTQLIKHLSGQYDHVVVDAPPVLGLADAPLLGSAVESIILVVQANRHKMRAISNALKRLQTPNAHVIGAIVTKVDTKDAAYGYGYGYGYGYSYGDNQAASA